MSEYSKYDYDIGLDINNIFMNLNLDTNQKDIIDNLKNHNWPGNVRELKNEIERMVIYTKTGERLRFFASEQNIPHKIEKQENETDFSPKYGVSLKETVHDFETFIIKNTIKQCGGNIQKAAKLLGVDRSSIYKKLKK